MGSTRFGEVAGAQGVRRQGFVSGGRDGSIDGFGVSFWRVFWWVVGGGAILKE